MRPTPLELTKPPPSNWRELVSAPKGTRRLEVEGEPGCGEWLLIDRWRGHCVGFSSRALAQESRAFGNRYIRVHGDINLLSFPYSLTDEHVPPDPEDCG